MTSRIARLVALSLPVLLFCLIASTGGWTVHDGRVERVGHVSTSAAAPVVGPAESTAPADEVTLLHHLKPSVPWPAWAGLMILCLLPGVASMVAWSGARRHRDTAFFAAGVST